MDFILYFGGKRTSVFRAWQSPPSTTRQEKKKTLRIVLLIKQPCQWLSDGAAALRSVFRFLFVTA